MGKFFVSSGLRDVGYTWINTDDGWDTHNRTADGKLQPDLKSTISLHFPSISIYSASIVLQFCSVLLSVS